MTSTRTRATDASCRAFTQSVHAPITRNEIADLRMCGCVLDCLSVTSYHIARIMGVHFRTGKWGTGKSRCGSVITTVIEGRSLYARVHRFLMVEGDECPGYASVSWFSEPHYLFHMHDTQLLLGPHYHHLHKQP